METGGGMESQPVTWSSRAATAGASGYRLQRRTACGDGRGDRGHGCGGGGEDGDGEVARRSEAAAAVAVTAVTGGMVASDG
ncbi:Os12g0215900 [Oryza sativa Japonica Group]|uniref:Os12g0215900 protein n=1 Tax=Oryza sativa subsp. japonica TaxID=39947 RepID=A0A0P0Y870_ORYSJ|nr:Os12g0215900 [Oryza sativa Japonica Group]